MPATRSRWTARRQVRKRSYLRTRAVCADRMETLEVRPAMYPASSLTRFLALYVALYAAFGVMSPFLPELLEQRGLTAARIGSLMALGTAARLVAGPLAGRLADQRRAWRAVLFACALAAALTGLFYLLEYSFWPLLIVSLGQAIALAPLAPLADAMAVSASRNPRGQFEYGWVRGAGSAAFIAGVLAGGHAAEWLGIDVLVWCNALLLSLAAVTALPLADIAVGPDLSREKSNIGAIGSLLRLPVFRRLLLVAALILGSHALHDTFAIISWRAAGIEGGTASLLWSESVTSEVVVFLLIGPAMLRRLGPPRAAALAAAAGVVRWMVLGATTNVVALALVEPLHGLTFALFHLAAMQLISTSVQPRLAATAQAVYGTVAVGAATALLMFASGWLYAWIGNVAFWMMALLCAFAVPLAFELPLVRTSIPPAN
jgi:MFS transporter, PPP family, 3-phenylpropionic acid transporter